MISCEDTAIRPCARSLRGESLGVGPTTGVRRVGVVHHRLRRHRRHDVYTSRTKLFSVETLMSLLLMIAITWLFDDSCRYGCEALLLAPLLPSTTTTASTPRPATAAAARSCTPRRRAVSKLTRSPPRVSSCPALIFGPTVVARLAAQDSEGNPAADSTSSRTDSIVDGGSPSSDTVDAIVEDSSTDEQSQGQAATRTVNQRLLDELREAAERESSSTALASSTSKKKKKKSLSNPFAGMSSAKTDEERQAAIEEAKDLNGINPVVTLAGSAFALAVAAALWTLTNTIAESFATHPVQSDLYAVQRAVAVFRNVVMGLFALASGFFGVTGMGIFLLGVRVAIGIAKGELDPTPLPAPGNRSKGGGVRTDGNEANDADDRAKVFSNAWELMTGGGESGRRRRRKSSRSDNDEGDDK